MHIDANLSFDWSGRCGKMKQSDKQEEVGRVAMYIMATANFDQTS